MIDLHIHTNKSDGEFSPTETAKMAKAAGIKIFSITDHDNIDSVKELKGTKGYVTGIEISTIHKGEKMHILGYGFDEAATNIKNLLSKLEYYRSNKTFGVVESIKKLFNIDLSEEIKIEIDKGRQANSPLIAEILIRKKFAKSFDCAFKKFINPAKKITTVQKVSTLDAFGAIRKDKGIITLAHPIKIMKDYKKDFLYIDQLLRRLKHKGLAAVECYHSDHDEKAEREFLEMTTARGMLISGGSDFHREGNRRRLGKFGTNFHLTPNEITIVNHLLKL